MTVSAKLIEDSVSAVTGIRMMTYEIEVPRIVWSEMMTHRMLSRNAASSRAIPFDKMLTQLEGIPSRFGANQAGMQDKGEDYHAPINGDYNQRHECFEQLTPVQAWDRAKTDAIDHSAGFKEAGYHKQVYNRLTEPFQMIKAVVSGTEWPNLFWLRNDKAADPTIAELAYLMYAEAIASEPTVLQAGHWHMPYVDWEFTVDGQCFKDGDGNHISIDDALKLSTARCAAVSYRNVDYDLNKSQEVFDRLLGTDKKHSSAFEHCAKVMDESVERLAFSGMSTNLPFWPSTWEHGISHVDWDGNLWSGNLRGWIQYRKTIPNEVYNECMAGINHREKRFGWNK